MKTTINLHQIVSAKASAREWDSYGRKVHTLSMIFIDKHGHEHEITTFSDSPLEIKGAEFVNHCHSGEREPA